MNIENKIKFIAEQMQLEYHCTTWYRMNVVLDELKRTKKLKYPAMLNILPVSGTITTEVNGQIIDTPDCILGFVCPCKLDFKADEVLPIIEDLKHLALKFFAAAEKLNLFAPVGEFNYTIGFDKFDQNVVILTVNQKIKELQGICDKEIESYDYSGKYKQDNCC